jgi:hypothetical protein
VPQSRTARAKETAADDTGRHLMPERWWESAPAICGVSLKDRKYFPQLPIDPDEAAAKLDQIREQGFTAIEIFAPAEGGYSYNGLDQTNYYRIDPEIGTMQDFRRLIRQAHSRGLAVITFENIGYSSVDAPYWLKACDDVREGRDTPEARRFVWSDRADAPAPALGSFAMSPGRFWGKWVFSKRAGKYYWSKWPGVDAKKNDVDLPAYNWADTGWQQEAEKVIRFWMDTGLDGMIIDAPKWYPNLTWELTQQRIVEPISSYRNVYMQPEGAGGGAEGPLAWLTEAGFNSVQDYGLDYPPDQEGAHVIRDAIERGDPHLIEEAMHHFHDRVVAAGGTLYLRVPRFQQRPKLLLAVATVACLGNLVLSTEWQIGPLVDPDVKWLFDTKGKHPALHNLSTRRRLPTNADDKYYAFLRTAADNSERLIVVLNFQPTEQMVEVTIDGVATTGLVELKSGDEVPRQNPLKVDLPGYGYRLYQVKSTADAGLAHHVQLEEFAVDARSAQSGSSRLISRMSLPTSVERARTPDRP